MKNKLIKTLVLIVSLCMLFFTGCKPAECDKTNSVVNETTANLPTTETAVVHDKTSVESPKPLQKETTKQLPAENISEAKTEQHSTEDVLTGQNTCILSVECKIVLLNINKLKKEKSSCIPEDGIIFAKKEVEFTSGETVFDLLLREMKNSKIHMEFTETPLYKSMYIKGINNLYEFDCGELSGWTYRVNGKIPSVGCSQCILQPGDVVEWIYSCDLGRDLD